MASLLQRLKKTIDTVDVVSFDIFDTAMTRLTELPTDVFFLLAHAANLPDPHAFRDARVLAEARAREIAWQERQAYEITLADIYDQLRHQPAVLGIDPDALREAERRLELRLCRPHPVISEAYDYALGRGKTVGFLSDMYLDADLLADMTAKCGYDGHSFFWVSSEVGATKAQGGLYTLALRRLRVPAKRVLHVGDNRHSDVDQARGQGLHAFFIPKCADLLPETPLGRRLHTAGIQRPLPGSSVHPALPCLWRGVAARNGVRHQNFWHDIGHGHVGALYLGFGLWLAREARKAGVEHLYFLARDGHIMLTVHELLRQHHVVQVPGSYLHASRRAFNVPALTAMDENACDFLVSGTSRITVRDFLERIGLNVDEARDVLEGVGFPGPDHIVDTGEDYSRLRALFRELAPRILAVAERERGLVRDYFAAQGLFEKQRIGLVDIGWHGSLQDSFCRLLSLFGHEPEVHGFYLGTYQAAQGRIERGARQQAYLFQTGLPEDLLQVVLRSVELFEWFFCAPHGSVLGFQQGNNGIEPVFEPADLESERLRTATAMQEGALSFVRDVLDACDGARPPDFPPDFSVAMIDELLREPTPAEAATLGDLPHAEGFGSVVRTRPLARPTGAIYKPWTWKNLRQGYETSFWKQAYLRRSVPRFLEQWLAKP